ncbi:uncharacterized protein LOC131155811 [Malania oleifera]|uniref:uncharacterized protein LOC131155811 n=1 Tax=Malania oleifera TaxID=397392 RepID=UPI0025AEB2C7|nr:uncharacterized protein LOC131155811 [Malania oleifera]XP_057965224.1 uncharacterized protein LOC131155811 [Malania oleifera]
MSRCFPFPPPGYEKKAKIDVTDSLRKEKLKEKKHKKKRTEKEKKEGKEKKEKERSKEKWKEKKDRKEKHRDKTDRDKDDGKNRNLDVKRIEGKTECYNGEKLGPNSMQCVGTKDFKLVQELDRRIRDEDKATGSQMVQTINVADQQRYRLPGMVESNLAGWGGGKDKINYKKEDNEKANGQRNKVEATGAENTTVQNYAWMDQRRVEGISRPMDKNNVEKQEGKKRGKHKESDSRGEKHLGRDGGDKSKSKKKDRNKEKKKVEEKTKEIRELNKELAKSKESGEENVRTCIIKPWQLLKDSNKSSAIEKNPGKRKGFEINGFLHDDIQPNKLPRSISSLNPVTENQTKLEPCQTDIASHSKGRQADNMVDIKEHEINGLVGVPQSVVCLKTPPSAAVSVNENGKASAKPPHPDSKYLNQILLVPKMEEWSDFDDQKWLFSSNNLQTKLPKGSFRDDGIAEVWAEAQQIESAGVSALPYVIPF